MLMSHCIEYAMSFLAFNIVYAMLFAYLCYLALSMPCYVARLSCIACLHVWVTLCLASWVALHLFGLGVSPNTRNEGRFILEVMKRASILGRRRSWSSMIKVKASCVYLCIHFTLNWAIWLLGHHASRCVISGPRVENRSPFSLWNDREGGYVYIHCKYIAMPFLALCCSKVEKCSKKLVGRPEKLAGWPLFLVCSNGKWSASGWQHP